MAKLPKGLIQIIEQAGATVEAVGIVIEKSFQDGRDLLEKAGYPVLSLARLDRFENGQVVFKEQISNANSRKTFASSRSWLATLTSHVLRIRSWFPS